MAYNSFNNLSASSIYHQKLVFLTCTNFNPVDFDAVQRKFSAFLARFSLPVSTCSEE
jgi:hypothetical protein